MLPCGVGWLTTQRRESPASDAAGRRPRPHRSLRLRLRAASLPATPLTRRFPGERHEPPHWSPRRRAGSGNRAHRPHAALLRGDRAAGRRRTARRPGTASTATRTWSASTASACSAAWACRSTRSARRSTTRPGACGRRWPPTWASSTGGWRRARGCGAGSATSWPPWPTADGDLAAETCCDVMEEMTMLDTTVQRRIRSWCTPTSRPPTTTWSGSSASGAGELTRDEDGRVVHGELQAGDGVVWLHPETAEFGLASPRTAGVATASVAVMVDDVDAHFRHAEAEGAADRATSRSTSPTATASTAPATARAGSGRS